MHQWLRNDAKSLKEHKRGVLLFLGVIHQISRSHGLKNRRFESNLSKITRPVAAIKCLRFALFINKHILLFEQDNAVHKWKAFGKTNNLTYNMLKLVEKWGRYCHFSEQTRYHKIDKNTTTTVKRHVNWLVSPRTMGYLIEKKYQVTGHYLCTKYILGCSELHFWRVCSGGEEVTVGYKKTPRLNCNNVFWGLWGHIFDNNLVLCGLIFFIHVPNELY